MASSGITALPLGPTQGFNWVFLVSTLVCGILTLFFLFYFNRLFATIISYAIRAYTWHKFRVNVDITSLQISLLGGRLFFKSIRYHGHNETVLVHDGRITWRYWLRKVQDAEIYQTARDAKLGGASDNDEKLHEQPGATEKTLDSAETAQTGRKTDLPCRFHVRVSGVEAFLYNHSPAYDALVSNFEAAERKKNGDNGKETYDSRSSQGDSSGNTRFTDDNAAEAIKLERSSSANRVSAASERGNKPNAIPSYLGLFPVQIECKKAAAAVGNENTPSVVVAKVEYANGTIDAGEAGALDLFKLLFGFDLEKVVVTLKPNPDFKTQQLAAAAEMQQRDDPHRPLQHRHTLSPSRLYHNFKRFVSRMHSMFSFHGGTGGSIRTASVQSLADGKEATYHDIPGINQWHGLERFLDDHDKAHLEEWEEVEYARHSTLIECPKIGMTFFWDIPGQVRDSLADISPSETISDDPNMTAPPDYGLDLRVYGGVVLYGPWADRQRLPLQYMFFPTSYVDAQRTPFLRPGETRLATVFKIHICIEETLIVRIPTREPSKDWRWQGKSPSNKTNSDAKTSNVKRRHGRKHSHGLKGRKRAQATTGIDMRPYGWIDLYVFKDTTVNYSLDMYARQLGYRNTLDVDVKGLEMLTSVNHGLLWRSGPVSVKGNLSNPLQWNTLRDWEFDIGCDDLDLFTLRDHMFLLIDLIEDWSSGPPQDFFTFVPFKYNLNLNFRRFKLFLNSNDGNLINNPASFDDNSFLVLGGEDLSAELAIHIDKYRPAKNGITFDVLSKHMHLDLLNQPRNSLHSLLQPKRVATLPTLTLVGSYTGYAEQSEELTDILEMDICGTGLDLKAFGFLIRHFVNVKENYFGDSIHFKTVEEFNHDEGNMEATLTDEVDNYMFRHGNDLDVLLCITVERPTILLPANIYSADNYIKAELELASVDLRVNNYYLDLETNASPIRVSFAEKINGDSQQLSDDQLFIESLDVRGHRLFGLPPLEAAYVSNWDIDVGSISGNCSPRFLLQMSKAGRSLAFTMQDLENALPLPKAAIIHDMVFVRVKTADISIWLRMGDGAVGLSIDPVSLEFTDRAGPLFSSRLTARIPNVTVNCISSHQSLKHATRRQSTDEAETLFFLQTTVDITVLQRQVGFKAERQMQLAHCFSQDERSKRASFFVEKSMLDDQADIDDGNLAPLPPAMPLPSMPSPLLSDSKTLNCVETGVSEDSADRRHPVQETMPSSARQKHASSIEGGEYNATGDNDSVGMAHLEKAFGITSSYLSPQFPLLPSEAVLNEAPPFSPLVNAEDQLDVGLPMSDLAEDADLDESKPYVSIIVQLRPGLRTMVKPQVTELALNILKVLQPEHSEDVLDVCHMDIMDNVTKVLQQRRGVGSVVELRLLVPSLDARLLNRPDPDASHQTQDQLDLTAENLIVSLRVTAPSEEAEQTGRTFFHINLDSFSVALSEAEEADLEDNAFQIDIEEILLWSVDADTVSSHVSFRILTTLIADQQIERILSATLGIMSAAITAEDKVRRFVNDLETRRKYLLYYLSTKEGDFTDPPYLSRMTYLIRAYPEHYRNQDSWKMIARFRHIYNGLSDRQGEELNSQLLQSSICPIDKQEMLTLWSEFCGWDISHLEESQIFKMVFGELRATPTAKLSKPTQMNAKLGVFRLLLGSVEKASEISIADLAVEVGVKPAQQPSGLMLVEENLRTLTGVYARSAAVLIRLRWDLTDLIVPVAQTYMDKIEPLMTAFARVPTTSSNPEFPDDRQDFHIIVSTNDGSIVLSTPNLQQTTSSRGIQMSLIGTSKAQTTYGRSICALVHAEDAESELVHADSCVWRTRLTMPNIYVDYRELLDRPAIELNIGGTYNELDVQLEHGLLKLISMADLVTRDEVAHALGLQKQLAAMFSKKPTVEKDQPGASRSILLNAALLAGPYTMDLAMLESLALRIFGESANLRVTPTRSSGTSLKLQANTSAVHYAFLRTGSKRKKAEALIHTPPLGFSAHVDIHPSVVDLKVSSIIEEMKVEAAAIQNILTVLRRPEVQGVLEGFRDGASDLVANVKATVDAHKGTIRQDPKQSRGINYDVNATLGGFKVKALAPAIDKTNSEAELVFGIGLTQLRVTNDQSRETAIPKFHSHIDTLYAGLFLKSRKSRKSCGLVRLGVDVRLSTARNSEGALITDVSANSDSLDVEVSAETASTLVDIATHIQHKIIDLDLSQEVDYLRRLRLSREERKASSPVKKENPQSTKPAHEYPSVSPLSSANLSLTLRRIRLAWLVGREDSAADHQDLELTLLRVELSLNQSHRARLAIHNLQLQMTPRSQDSFSRSLNSALLPEVVFTVFFESQDHAVSVALRAAGKALDLRLESRFMVPLHVIIKSMIAAIEKYRSASAQWKTSSIAASGGRASPFGDSRLQSLLVDASFAGAVMYVEGDAQQGGGQMPHFHRGSVARPIEHAKLSTTLKAPGIALKLEFLDSEQHSREATMNGEVRVEASSNTVFPELVPIALQISDCVKGVIQEADAQEAPRTRKPSTAFGVEKAAPRLLDNDALLAGNPLFAKTKISLGLRICKQEFGLSCQPIARVDAHAQIEDIYLTLNTVELTHGDRSLALSLAITTLAVNIKHEYSRESTFSFSIESLALSVMNSKHVSGGSSGITAVLSIRPTSTKVNVRQLQDLLLFKEIWIPQGLRDERHTTVASPTENTQEFLVQRYREIADAAAFPWNATVHLVDLAVELDLGQSIGRTSLGMKGLWATSQKSSSRKSDLCLGIDEVSAHSTGRMGGFIELEDFKVRTSIEWPADEPMAQNTPLIQAALGFAQLRVKAAFEYQPFAFADVESFDFLMYNVRRAGEDKSDNLAATLDSGNVIAYCTATSPAQAVGLYQAFDRLIIEKQAAYRQSLQELGKHLRHLSVAPTYVAPRVDPGTRPRRPESKSMPISLRTDVMVKLRAINLGAFPGSFLDSQILKLEANDVEARFAVGVVETEMQSNLSMNLGQLEVSLASVKRVKLPKVLGDISLDEVITNAALSKGGGILHVPKVVASMRTWQAPERKHIDYIFKSLFEGKVDVGWNYSRISFIRGMWDSHTRSLAARLGKPLPESAVKITTDPEQSDSKTGDTSTDSEGQQGRITAVVNMPQSRYEYRALEPPIVETPQLRDMGEATPPLEWIGLQREKLPHVVHQVIIVTLQEVAKEVEDAYGHILGAS